MTHTLNFDGSTVIPIFITSPSYREWELTLDGQDFCIVNDGGDGGDWVLMQWSDNDVTWQEVGSAGDVDAFRRHTP